MLLTTIKAFLGGIVNQFVEFWKLQYYLVLTLQEMRKEWNESTWNCQNHVVITSREDLSPLEQEGLPWPCLTPSAPLKPECLPWTPDIPTAQTKPWAFSGHREMPQRDWLRWGSGECVAGPSGTEQSGRQFSVGYRPQGMLQTADWNIAPVFLGGGGEAYLLVREPSAWGAGFRFTSHLEATEELSGNVIRGDTIFAPSLGLTVACWFLPERSVNPHLEPQFFHSFIKGTLPHRQVGRPVWVMAMVP